MGISSDSDGNSRPPTSQTISDSFRLKRSDFQVRRRDWRGSIEPLDSGGERGIVRFEDLGLWGLPEGAEYAD